MWDNFFMKIIEIFSISSKKVHYNLLYTPFYPLYLETIETTSCSPSSSTYRNIRTPSWQWNKTHSFSWKQDLYFIFFHKHCILWYNFYNHVGFATYENKHNTLGKIYIATCGSFNPFNWIYSSIPENKSQSWSLCTTRPPLIW